MFAMVNVTRGRQRSFTLPTEVGHSDLINWAKGNFPVSALKSWRYNS